MSFTASITRRNRRRRLRSGRQIEQTRFVVNFRDPATGRRKQLFFARHKDAVTMRDALLASAATGSYSDIQTSDLTVSRIVEHWLENRRREVKAGTWASYRQAVHYILGPLLVGTKWERHQYARTGARAPDSQLIEMLGQTRVADLTTADIRNWNRAVADNVSAYTANVAKKFLKAALALAAEELQLRVPAMPTRLGRGRPKPRKVILSPAQVGCLLAAALEDGKRGIYYAFPFLTGVRPSEQLALLWSDIELEVGRIRIRRMQERDGSTTEVTKTAAGRRDIPISPRLREMLERWRHACPAGSSGEPARVFPSLGSEKSRNHRKRGSPLSYVNFRSNYWRPALVALGLPYVTPHSARHAFISTLQAQGVEVGLVAKLAGHANANVTLSHYTQAVRGGEAAIAALEHAYGEHPASPVSIVITAPPSEVGRCAKMADGEGGSPT
jgi:integrase